MSVLGSDCGRCARLLRRVVPVMALALLAALVLAGAIDPLQSGLLTMAPALMFAAMMLARPYMGERAIARLRVRPSRRRRRVAARVPAFPGAAARMVRGGRLIAAALAGRAPPAALASR
ncbi:MAG TPA: hypothetical protein VK790_09610 [Solirubrobacteraceae bacterium]|jgi:hypothetical protein|nr:hypothetical protein [Solirubrobacteraceae bacterium]